MLLKMVAQKLKLIAEQSRVYNLVEIKRTANAGVLLKIDGVSILLDGVCGDLYPYIGTPENIRNELIVDFPDILAFTHMHEDHYDEIYAELYKKDTLRSVYGPELSHFSEEGTVKLQAVSTRHIGKSDLPHVSFIISGSKCVWFMGDASPLVVKKFENIPSPDILIVPYAYVNTKTAWELTKSLGAKDIVVLHLPSRNDDSERLWEAVETIVGNEENIHIPDVGDVIIL